MSGKEFLYGTLMIIVGVFLAEVLIKKVGVA